MTIAVTTPTGHVGSHVVRMLCQAGVRPRLLVRNPERLDPDLRDLVDVAVGDQRDAEYVADSMSGVDAVFWVHPDDWSLRDPDADAEQTGQGLAAAIRKHRVPRVVFQSSVGAELRQGAGFIDGLARVEQQLDAAQEETGSGLLHLRCGYFMTNLLMDLDSLCSGRLTTVGQLDRPMSWVDPQDVATVATVRLLSDNWTGRQVQAIHGPVDLSWTEAASILTTVTGISIDAHQVNYDEQRAALQAAGLSPVAVEGILGMSVTQNDGFIPEQPRSQLTTTPSSLASWAITHLRPALKLRRYAPLHR
ncbi:NAD(P)H-binding protein [Leifsonia sp. A12D58]|uniref:NAD(P)H-binding protein n=1 Tax=Leifsonia sp. A12D58 TaxID=3397674 RepID=UPI0039E19C66